MAKVGSKRQQYGVSIAFATPFLLLFFIFTVIPVISAFVISFFNYNMLQPMKFVGLQNYLTLLLYDDVFMTSINNTFIIAFIY